MGSIKTQHEQSRDGEQSKNCQGQSPHRGPYWCVLEQNKANDGNQHLFTTGAQRQRSLRSGCDIKGEPHTSG